MQFPTLVSDFLRPSLPSVYPGQTAGYGMSREYFMHHSRWTLSGDFRDQLAGFEHKTPFDVDRVTKKHQRRMRMIAEKNGYDFDAKAASNA